MAYRPKRRVLQAGASDDDDESLEPQNPFIDNEADEYDSDSEEPVPQEVAAAQRVAIYSQPNKSRAAFAEKLNDPKQYAEQIEARQRYEEDAEEAVGEAVAAPLQDGDPRLYSIRCRIGREEDVACRVRKKWTTPSAPEMAISSVVVPEKKKGVISVEAVSETKLVDALEGIRDLYLNTFKELPEQKMRELVTTRMPDLPELNTYVRVKGGKYKGDLGIVTQYVDGQPTYVWVKLVPRFDAKRFQEIARLLREQRRRGKDEDEELARRRQRLEVGGHPEKQLFLARELGIEDVVETKVDEDDGVVKQTFDHKVFYDGLVYRRMKITTLETENVDVREDEVMLLHRNNEYEAKGKTRFNKRRVYQERDRVRMVSEDPVLHGKLARVLEVNGALDQLLIEFEDDHQGVLVNTNDVQIVFETGDRVKVNGGVYAGETGVIECVRDNEALVYSDTKMSSIAVSLIDLVFTTEVSQPISELKGFKINDFIQMASSVGIVLGIHVDSGKLQVLNHLGQVERVDPAAVQGKYPEKRDVRCRDRNGNFVGLGDVVEITAGVHRGRQGRVAHIFQFDKIFVTCPGLLENNSYLVVSNRDIVGPNATHRSTSLYDGKGRGERGEYRRDDRGGGLPSDMTFREMRGKQVTILHGPHKNYTGKVTKVQGKQLVIVLNATGKTIKMEYNEDEIKFEDRHAPKRVERKVIPPNTPAIASTPMINHMATPGHHSLYAPTPAHTMQTPAYSIATPRPDPMQIPATPSTTHIPQTPYTPNTSASSYFSTPTPSYIRPSSSAFTPK